MRLVAFRVQMYRNVIDSGWIKVNPLTVLVGKNESGKTTLLRALHKLKPFAADPYSMDSEWPRGRRPERKTSQVACTARFQFTSTELEQLDALISARPSEEAAVEVSRTYAGAHVIAFPADFFPGRLRTDEIEKQVAASLPQPATSVGDGFRSVAESCRTEIGDVAARDAFEDITKEAQAHIGRLQAARSADGTPEHAAEQQYIASYFPVKK